MDELKTAMKNEALNRMNLLDLHENVIKEFHSEGKLNRSDPGGILFWLDEEQEKRVRDWEKKTGNMVYHVIHTYTTIGEMLSLMYISKYPEEWELDRNDISEGQAVCYVINLSDELCSEAGAIGIQPMNGGVVRTW